MKTVVAAATFHLRLLHARFKKGTVRFKTTQLPAFYGALAKEKVPYVVLRWSDDVPLTPETEISCAYDVDHLIADNHIKAILKIAAQTPGRVKCDYYSASGQSGTSYNGMPYYPPAIAQDILSRRVLDPRGFFRPCPKDEFYAFAYHLCYHKGQLAGIPSGVGGACVKEASRDYFAGLKLLADNAGIDVTGINTLLDLHLFLQQDGWGMPLDLMIRWPKQHGFLTALIDYTQQELSPQIKMASALTIFILREDCDTEEKVAVARKLISERFQIVEEVLLDPAARLRVMRQTRGGNWIEKGKKQPTEPTTAYLCRNSREPGPLPKGYSAAKVAKRYPHLVNTDVLIKRVIRKLVNDMSPLPHNRVVIHATDNAQEAVETLHAVLRARASEFLTTF